MKREETFKTTQHISLSNSFGTLKSETVELQITVGIKDEGYGWFELYDTKTGGEEWYAEGGLLFENGALVDYDGVFSLPPSVVDKLNEWGYDVDEFYD
jgi:hypothetical protein